MPRSAFGGSLFSLPLMYHCRKMSTTIPAYHEIIDFIAGGTTPAQMIKFHPSEEAQQRVAALIEKEQDHQTTPEEKEELDHFMELEHILRMAKAKARQILASGQ